MKFFWEEDTVFLHLVKYFGKDSTNISRVILCGPNCPVTHLAPVSPNCFRVGYWLSLVPYMMEEHVEAGTCWFVYFQESGFPKLSRFELNDSANSVPTIDCK